MTIIRADDIHLWVDDGGGSYTLLGGVRSTTTTFTAKGGEATGADNQGWRALLACASLRQMVVNGTGIFVDDAAAMRAQSLFFANQAGQWRLEISGTGTYSGAFLLTRLEVLGDVRGEGQFALTLTSSGPVTFVPTL